MNLFLAATEAAVESSDPPNPVLPELNEIFWSAVFFLLLWVLMKYVLIPPINRIRQQREEKINSEKDAIENAKQDQQRASDDYQNALGNVKAEAAEVMNQARLRADQKRDDLIKAAEAEISEMRNKAEAEIKTAAKAALSDLDKDLQSLAKDAASSILGSEADIAIIDRHLKKTESG